MKIVSGLLSITALTAALLSPARAHASAATPFAPPQDDIVVFRNATLFDGTGTSARPGIDVVINGDRIQRIVPDADLGPDLLHTARIIDLRGRFLMPGLIDAHVHLATPPNRRQAEAILRRDIYGGVTTVRDMADDLRAVGELTRASLVGEIAAPDIYYAALMAGPPFFVDKRTWAVSAGGRPGSVPWMQAVTDNTDLSLAVAEARGTYATAIKLYADLSGDLAAKITAEAHRQGIKVWAHATLFPAKPSEMVAAGVDAISHACLLVRETPEALPDFHHLPPVNVDAFRGGNNLALARLFTDMARRGTIFDPTVWLFRLYEKKPSVSMGRCDDTVAGAITRQAYQAGVAIDAGTDDIADWTDPWPTLFQELAALSQKAGMPNGAVLQSATLIGARAAGQERDTGSIEVGKLANLVVLARDPLADLNNLKSVVMTIKRGRMFDRSAYVPLTKDDITDL